MPADPAMPRQMPPAVERELHRVLGWVNAKPAPVDFYLAIRDALVEAKPGMTRASAAVTPPEPTPADYLDRARRFERAAQVVVSKGHPDTAPAALHLIAHALELTLKAVLLREGRTAKELKRAPNGHDVAFMWGLAEIEFLRRQVPAIAASAVMDARASSRWPAEFIADGDPGDLFAEQVTKLSALHSAETDFALRYPAEADHLFPRVPFLADVVGCLIDEAKAS